MPKLNIDGREIEVADGLALIQACEEAGIEIPRFCYHERLSVAGNCRMCLVEVVGMPKLVASCALGVNDMRPGPNGEPPVILTNSEKVQKARQGVMEFQLINHPLDCPICDQGGECDLQDEAMAYGLDHGRFTENKHAVRPKNMGPLIKTMMNRCIHCTRCVRFIAEVAGTQEIGATGRGEDTEILTYLQGAVTSELSGNVIDLCPVGALTSLPYAFSARPWELRKTESIDVMDAVGSNIRVDSRGAAVMRILPRNHDDVNEEWLADKGRFVWDGLKSRRLDRPYVRKAGQLVEASWDDAFDAIAARMNVTNGARMAALVGDLNAAEEIFALKDLLSRRGVSDFDCRTDRARLGHHGRAAYLFNTTIAGIEAADALLLIGCNPRREAAVLNARIRKRWLAGDFPVGLIGPGAELTYDVSYLGAGPESLHELAEGKGDFARILNDARRPMLILGQGACRRDDGEAVMSLAARLAIDTGMLADGWNGFNVLHTAAAQVAALDLGFMPATPACAPGQHHALVWLLGVDDMDMDQLGDAFVIYQGSHGDAGARRADVILPGAAYTEKDGTYVNTEGRVQLGQRAVFPPGEAREDWKIIRALSGHLDTPLPYDTLEELRAAMMGQVPHLGRIDEIEPADPAAIEALAAVGGATDSAPFADIIGEHYRTNPILRASRIMAECQQLADDTGEATGTDG